MGASDAFLEDTVRDVTERVVQRAPHGGELVWIWREAKKPDAPTFMRYGDEPLLGTFREILGYVVRAVWYRAYRQGLSDAASGTDGALRGVSLLPAAVLNADTPNEETLQALFAAATTESPNTEAEKEARRVLGLLQRGASVRAIEEAVFGVRDAAHGDERWTLFCAEVLLHLTGRSVQE